MTAKEKEKKKKKTTRKKREGLGGYNSCPIS